MSEGGFIIDSPKGIKAFGLLQIYYKLKLEIERPNGPRWRQSPSIQAVHVMRQAGVNLDDLAKQPRKAKVFARYRQYLLDTGVLKENDGDSQ